MRNLANSDDVCLVIYKDKIYNLLPFQYKHPGGQKIIIDNKGKRADKHIENTAIHRDQ